MKKLVSGVLSLAMVATSAFTAVVAEEDTTSVNLTDLYASRGNVYLTFDAEPTDDTAVAFKSVDGGDVSYTATVQEGNVLRLTPSEKLDLDEKYRITVGEADKIFEITSIASEDFSDNSYAETLDFYKVGGTAANQARVGFLDGKLFMQQRYASYFTLKDGLVDTLKNYTVEFDMETYHEHMAGIMFNKTMKNQQFRYGTKTAGVDEIGWIFGTQNDWARGLFRYERTDDAQTDVINGNNSGSYTMVTDRILPSTYKITYDDAMGTIGLDTTTATRLPQSNTYTVDKMGRTGVLSLDDVVKDVYSSENASETGYFFIGSTNSWNMNNTTDGRGISLDNIVVTTCEVSDYIPDPNMTDIYASKKNVYVYFDGVPNTDMAIEFKDTEGKDVTCSKAVQDGNVLRLTPESDLEVAEYYTVKVGELTKAFKIKKLATEDFSDNSYAETLDFYKAGGTAANQARVGFLDGKLFMQQRYLSFFTLKDGLVNNLKNYTVEFDMETYVEHMAGIAFNKTEKNQQFRYGTKTAGVDEIGWIFGGGNTWSQKLFRYERTDDAQTDAINGNNSGNYKAVTDRIIPSTYKITYDDATGTIGLDTTTATALPQSNTYTVDKMGRTGVLSLDDVVKDVYSSENASETGYFFIGSTNSWNMNNTIDGRGISLDNILVTTCEELASGISIASVSMTDSSGNTIEAVGGQSTIKGNVIISNLYETEKPVTVVIAAYIDDTMISSKIINTSSKIQAGELMNCPYELTGVETANNVKVFVWDSFEGMVPWTTATVIKSDESIDYGEELVIGYIGGSLTQGGEEWRNGVTDFFFEKNPELKVTAYNAGISGTNSQQGAIRYKRDILSHNPDIVFIEFAVNDCGRDEQNSKEHIESMIRQSLEAEKIPYIILLYAPEPVDKDTDIYESWKKGVNWKEEIANHYGLKSINIYDYMYSDYEMLKEDDEELTFFEYLGELGYKKTSDTTYDVHAGYGKYKEAILKELENNFSECMTKPEKKLAYCTSSVFDWDYIHIPVDSNRLTFKGEWNKYTKENQYSGSYEHSIPGVDYSYPYFPEGIAQTEVANSSFEFETTVGVTGIMLSYISSTAGADASVYVDGTRTGSFSCYSQYHRMNYHSAWISVPNDGKTHLVNVVVDGINDEKTVFRFGSVIERYVK